MKSAERVWKVWVNISEVEHTSERVQKSAEGGGGAEALWKIVEGLWRGCRGLRNRVGMWMGRGGVQN